MTQERKHSFRKPNKSPSLSWFFWSQAPQNQAKYAPDPPPVIMEQHPYKDYMRTYVRTNSSVFPRYSYPNSLNLYGNKSLPSSPIQRHQSDPHPPLSQ